MASPMQVKQGITLGQFLLAEDVNQAGSMACNLKSLDVHDVIMIKKVLLENWEDEEQMVSNLLQFPHLIPEDIRIDCIRRGLVDSESPYYMLSAAVGIQKMFLKESEWEMLFEALKSACLHDIGVVSMRAFMTIQPKLKYPNHTQFITDILSRPKSSLFQNALTWLILQVKNKTAILKILNDAEISEDSKKKADGIIHQQLMIEKSGEDPGPCLQFLNYIPNLNDFEAMLDKQDTLSEFFTDLDTDKDDMVSLDQVQSFLEDIGKNVSLEELKKELKSMDVDLNDKLDKDAFIEIMFPRFQMR